MSTESDPIILPGTVNDSVLEVIVTGDTPAEPSSDVSDVVVVSKATAVEASTSPDSQQSTSPPSDPLVFSGQSVWRADQSGSASANEINVGGLIQAVFSDTDKRAILLSQYGLVDLSVPQNSPTPTLRSVTFFEGQSGSWSESTNIYVPSWDIAFSQDAVTVFFQIAYDVADPLRPTSILEGLTADLKLVFNQASLAFLQSAQSGSAPLLLTNLDDIGIALAFGHDRQVALGRPADTLAVSIDSSLNIEGELPFTSEAFFAALELISSSTPVFKDPTPVTRSLQILSIHDDTGSSSSDFITNTNGPLTIKGTSFGLKPGDQVQISFGSDDPQTLTYITPAFDGTWEYTDVSSYQEDFHEITYDACIVDATKQPVSTPTQQIVVIDRLRPEEPELELAEGLGNVITAAQAVQESGIAFVTGEAEASVEVTFENTTSGDPNARLIRALTLPSSTSPEQFTLAPIQLSIDDLHKLGEGTIAMSAVVIDKAGNISDARVDTFQLSMAAPSGSVEITSIDQDTGRVNDSDTESDFITSDSLLVIRGTADGLELGDRVQLSTDGVHWMDAAQVPDHSESGSWVYSTPRAQAEGSVRYRARIFNEVTGLVGGETEQQVVVDTSIQTPVLSIGAGGYTPTLQALQASGVVTVSAEPDSEVAVTFSSPTGSFVKTVTIPSNGDTVSVSLSEDDLDDFPSGVISVNAVATDLAGNVSQAATLSFQLNLSPPPASLEIYSIGSDDEPDNNTYLTRFKAPEVKGTVDDLGVGDIVEVRYRQAGGVWSDYEVATLNEDKTEWSFIGNAQFSDGYVEYDARVLNQNRVVGNSDQASVLIDSVPPSTPTFNPVTSDNFISSAERVSGVLLSGSGDAGTTVFVTWDKVSSSSDYPFVRSTVVQSNGTWSISYPLGLLPSPGEYSVRVTSQDRAGNEASSPDRIVRISNDNLAPTNISLKPVGLGDDLRVGIPSVLSQYLGYTESLGRIFAEDPDSDPVTYFLSDPSQLDNSLVEIDETSGEITFVDSTNDTLSSLFAAARSRGGLRISVTAKDNPLNPASSLRTTRTIVIPFVDETNRAPTATGGADLDPITQGTAASRLDGKSISDLFEGGFNDPDDSDAELSAVAIVANQSSISQGRWQYQAKSSNYWVDLPVITLDSPFILLASDKIRFVPSSNFSGSPGELSVHLLEDIQGTTWQRGVLTASQAFVPGGSSPISQVAIPLRVAITPVPKSPTDLAVSSNSGVPSTVTGALEPFATFIGSDPDTPLSQLTYSLVSARGNSSSVEIKSLFYLDPSTGQVRLTGSPSEISGFTSIRFEVSVSDGTRSLSKPFVLGVNNGTNLSPTVLPNLSRVFLASPPNDPDLIRHSPGISVSSLFESSFVDPDRLTYGLQARATFAGVAVVGNLSSRSEGVWRYRLDEGSPWIPLNPGEKEPFLLPSNAFLSFLPRSSFTGIPGSLQVRLLDETILQGASTLTPGKFPDLAIGGSGPASDGVVTLSTDINARPSALFVDNSKALDNSVTDGTIIAELRGEDLDTSSADLKYYLDPIGDNDNRLVTVNENGDVVISDVGGARTLDDHFLDIRVRVVDDEGNSQSFVVNLGRTDNAAPVISRADSQSDWRYRLPQPILRGTAASSLPYWSLQELFLGTSTPFRFVDNAFTGSSSNQFARVAVVSNGVSASPSSGRWQYQLPGQSFENIPNDLAGQPFFLPSTALLRFRPSSFFVGDTPALGLRLLDNSSDDFAYLLPGGSGNATTDIVELLAEVKAQATQENRSPQSLTFAPARQIVVVDEGRLAPGSRIGRLVTYDPDTDSSALRYSFRDLNDPLGSSLSKLELVDGEIRLKSGQELSRSSLESIRFEFSVSDGVGRPSIASTFQFNQQFGSRFVAQASAQPESQSVVLPLVSSPVSGSNSAIQFSVPGAVGSLSVQPVAVLSADDLTSLGLQSAASQQILPLAPLLDFSIDVANPGDVVRFEFELPNLPLSDLLSTKYVKLVNGEFRLFEYAVDEYGIGTGARLEQQVGDQMLPLHQDSSGITYLLRDNGERVAFDPNSPTFLAVYIADNGAGDDDSSLGLIRDPGAPLLLRSVAVEPPVSPGGGGSGGQSSFPPGLPSNSLPAAPPIPSQQPISSDVTLSPVPEVLQRLGLDPASIRFEQVGTSEPDRVVVKSNDIRSFALGPGSDHFIVKDSRSRTPFTVDAGDGSDLIRTRLGSDVILAGAGDDRVKASASSKPRAKGEAEVDLVSGGLGSDLFVLGNRQGSFYLDLKGRGDSSYALISDFGSGDRITLSKSLAKSYRIEATSVPGLPDVSAYALSVRQDVVAVIVLDPSRDEGLSIKDRSSFVFEKR